MKRETNVLCFERNDEQVEELSEVEQDQETTEGEVCQPVGRLVNVRLVDGLNNLCR